MPAGRQVGIREYFKANYLVTAVKWMNYYLLFLLLWAANLLWSFAAASIAVWTRKIPLIINPLQRVDWPEHISLLRHYDDADYEL